MVEADCADLNILETQKSCPNSLADWAALTVNHVFGLSNLDIPGKIPVLDLNRRLVMEQKVPNIW